MTSSNPHPAAAYRSRTPWSTLWIYPVVLILLSVALSSCSKDRDIIAPTGGGSSGNGSPSPSPSASPAPVTDENAVNVMKFHVNDTSATGYCSAGSYTNKPCAKITVCDAGGGNCVEVKDVLIDTGSYGLRLFKQRISSLNLAPSGAGNIAECVEYGDGSRQWGPVKVARVKLGNEPQVSVPIQVIDYTFPGMQENCPGAEKFPDQGPSSDYAGMSGILGIGVFQSDCGPYCATQANNNTYYQCNGSTCTSTTVSEANQVQNPVALLPVDNNGVIVRLPQIPNGGTQSVTGYLIFGVGTRDNNQVSGRAKTSFPLDPDYGEFTATYQGQSYKSFIDTGSNALGLPGASFPDCGGDMSGWLCPNGTTSQSALVAGYNGFPTESVGFRVGNFRVLFSSGNACFNETAYSSPANISSHFDWGLPFYYGRDVYHGFEKKSSVLGSGVYFAW